jgi:hypothetical protein
MRLSITILSISVECHYDDCDNEVHFAGTNRSNTIGTILPKVAKASRETFAGKTGSGEQVVYSASLN